MEKQPDPRQQDGRKDTTRDELAELRREMATMQMVFQQVVSNQTVEHVLVHGFSTLSAQLQPLASLGDLAPKRPPMQEADLAKLAQVRAELARPNWTGTTTLEPPPFAGTEILITTR